MECLDIKSSDHSAFSRRADLTRPDLTWTDRMGAGLFDHDHDVPSHLEEHALRGSTCLAFTVVVHPNKSAKQPTWTHVEDPLMCIARPSGAMGLRLLVCIFCATLSGH
jgi:hypothetical protein